MRDKLARTCPRRRERLGNCRVRTQAATAAPAVNWSLETKLPATDGQAWPTRAIDMVNRSMMAHPIHLHGHAFQVLAINNKKLRGAMRDTVLVPPMGQVMVEFDPVNPGRWALHCHNLYHVAKA